MKKRRSLPIIMILFLIAVLLFCGTVMAFMFSRTEVLDNTFTPAEVSCRVEESFDGANKTSITVENTGNIKSYIRLRLVSYWVNDDGNVVAKPSVIPDFSIQSEWLEGADNTYYYKDPVAPNEKTGEFLADQITLEISEEGYLQVVEVFAEAIQSEPKKAAESAWNVVISDSGEIGSIN